MRRDGTVATAWQVPARATASPSGTGPLDRVPSADDLAAVVAACRTAATRSGAAPAQAPWLPPLPEVIRPHEVAGLLAVGNATGPPHGGRSRTPATGARSGTGTGPTHDFGSGSGSGSGSLSLGVIDLPHRQARDLLRWHLSDDGHLAIVGAPGSGRTGAVRAIVGAVCRAPDPVHVHIVDGAGRLAGLTGLPRVGTVVPVTDTERAGRLLARLAEHVRVASDGRAASPGPPVVLAVDGWEQLLDAWFPVDHGRLVDDLIRLARDGTGERLRLAVTGGRALLTGAIGAVLTERLLLRAADPTDLVLAGVPASALPGRMPPGRAVRVLAGAEVVEAQVGLDDLTGLPHDRQGEQPPLRLASLPDRVSVERLCAELRERPGGARDVLNGGTLPVGIGGDDAAPLGPAAGGPGWLVVGQPGSGRSSTLAAAAAVLVEAGRQVVTVAGPGGPLTGGEAVPGRSTPSEPTPSGPTPSGPTPSGPTPAWSSLSSWALRTGTADVLAVLDAAPTSTFIVDDLSALPDHVQEQVLARLDDAAAGAADDPADQSRSATAGGTAGGKGRWPAGPGPFVLGTCTPGEAAVAYRGLTARLRTTGGGVLLAPIGPGDGEAFGIRVPALAGAPPGRALVVTAGKVQAVQVAVPE
jgi:S-DNA-T family DNA segregation ATPase FtsK/SpoIIIE